MYFAGHILKTSERESSEGDSSGDAVAKTGQKVLRSGSPTFTLPAGSSRYPVARGIMPQVHEIEVGKTWMTVYQCYLADGILPLDPAEARKIKKNSSKYTVLSRIRALTKSKSTTGKSKSTQGVTQV